MVILRSPYWSCLTTHRSSAAAASVASPTPAPHTASRCPGGRSASAAEEGWTIVSGGGSIAYEVHKETEERRDTPRVEPRTSEEQAKAAGHLLPVCRLRQTKFQHVATVVL